MAYHENLIFKNLEDANNYNDMEDPFKGYILSSIPRRNDSTYNGPDYGPIIYEIEIDERKKQLQSSEYCSDDRKTIIPCYKFSSENISIVSATLEGVKYTFNEQMIKNIPTFENFKTSFNKQYDQLGFFRKNLFGSELKKKLESQEISTMSKVYDYADNHPNSAEARLIYNSSN